MPWLATGASTHELREGDAVVGSGPDADWRVTTADLSTRHFVVRVHGDTASVEPCSGDDVVALNGQQVVAPSPVRDGEMILAGSGRFSFTYDRPQTEPTGEWASDQAYLVDDVERVAHRLSGRSTPIGRDASNLVVIRDPATSRFHAEVRQEAGGFAIHSIGAVGTLLNGHPVERPAMLHEGDRVEIAFSRLRFTRQAPSGGITLAPQAPAESDEAARRRTLEPGERVVVDDASPAGRHTRRIQLLVGLGVVLAAVLWWALARRP